MPRTFGALLRKYRETRGMTTRELADLSDTGQGTITLVEQGKRSPPAASVGLWAKALKLTPEQRDSFWLAAFKQRAAKDARWGPYLAHIESRMGSMADALREMAQLCRESGVPVSAALAQRIEALSDGV